MCQTRQRIQTLLLTLAITALCGCHIATPYEQMAGELDTARSSYDGKSVAIFPFDVVGGESTAGRAAAEKLTREMVRRGTYRILERSAVEKLLEEQNLGQSGLVDTNKAVELGRILSADLVLLGTAYLRNGYEEVIVRLVATETSEIIATAMAHVQEGSPASVAAQPREIAGNTANSSQQSTRIEQSGGGRIETPQGSIFSLRPQARPQGEIVTLRVVRSTNNLIFMGLVRNTGQVALDPPRFPVTLKDRNGKQFDVTNCIGTRPVLVGETISFRCVALSAARQYQSHDFTYQPRELTWDTGLYNLSASSINMRKETIGSSISGVVRNDEEHPVGFIRILATFYDASGNFAGTADGIANNRDTPLAPGREIPFQIRMIGSHTFAEPARLEFHFNARPISGAID